MTVLLMALWLALNLADVWTTHRAFKTNPHAIEGNPIMWALLNFGGEWFMHGCKLALAGGLAWLVLIYGEPWLILIPAVPIGYAVWSNVRFIR
jgi:hypothetical protein